MIELTIVVTASAADPNGGDAAIANDAEQTVLGCLASVQAVAQRGRRSVCSQRDAERIKGLKLE